MLSKREREAQEARDALIRDLVVDIENEIVACLSGDVVSLEPGQVFDVVFERFSSRLDAIHPYRALEVARQKFHYYWIAALSSVLSSGAVTFTATTNLRLPRQYTAAA